MRNSRRQIVPPRAQTRAQALPLPPLMAFLRREDRWLIVIHAVLAFLTPLLLLAFTGCIEREDPVGVDYGPAVDPGIVAEALEAPLVGTSPLSVKVGEFTHSVTSQRVGLSEASATGHLGITITEIVSTTADEVKAKAFVNEFKYDSNGRPVKSSFEGVGYCFPVTVDGCPSSQQATSASKLPTMNALMAQPIAKIAERVSITESNTVSFHRFQAWTEETDPPVAVQERENCLGIPKCKINVHWVRFDKVYWLPDGPEAISYRIAQTPEVPYLSMNTTMCIAQMVKINEAGHRVYYEQCRDVADFVWQ